MLWLIKTDFVLTTLATCKQSQIFPQHIAPETPLQPVCDFLLMRKNMVSQLCVYLFIFCIRLSNRYVKKKYKTENRYFLISRNMFSVKNQMHVIPLAANPRDLKEQKQKHMFSMFSNFVSVYWVVFMFSIFCQCFSFLIISFNFCSFPAFLSWTNTLPI